MKLALLFLPALLLDAQPRENYLDVDTVKVKMGKRAAFDAVNKRMAELNRRNHGDHDLAYEVVYGDPAIVCFLSTRASYRAAEEGNKAFEAALTKTLGAAGMQKMYDEWDSYVDADRQELRRRRWDLTASPPLDDAAYHQLVGRSRYLRTVVVHTRPGKAADYESELKLNREAQERVNPGVTFFVDQAVAGQSTGVYYITTFLKSLADLDAIKTLELVRASTYSGYLKTAADAVESAEIVIGRFLPEQSNLPADVVAAAPEFWRPTPAPVKPKPNARQ